MQAERMEPDAHGARLLLAIDTIAVQQPQSSFLEEAA